MASIGERSVLRYRRAVEALEKALALGLLPENADRDSVVLRFELAAELTPKVLRRILSERGSDVTLPKDIIREARAAKLLEEAEAETLLLVIDDRNRMVHDYSEEYALALEKRIRNEYAVVLRTVAQRLGA